MTAAEEPIVEPITMVEWPIKTGRISVGRWWDGRDRISVHLGERDRRHGMAARIVTPFELRALADELVNAANQIEALR